MTYIRVIRNDGYLELVNEYEEETIEWEPIESKGVWDWKKTCHYM